MFFYVFRRSKKQDRKKPFDHKGYAHFSYTLDPHRVFRLSKNDNKLSTVGLTGGNINWSESFGEIHGGTPSLKDGDSYFGFFHSWKDLKSIQSKGEKISHFFMGAYLFNEKPPFELTHISDKPIIGKTFFHGPDYETWKPIKAIYPGGFVFTKKHVWVVYGRQDHECWVVKMDKKALIQSLISVN
jgi:hypothetical protein